MASTRETAVIVIDSGFSHESLLKSRRVLGVYDLRSGFKAEGAPVAPADQDRFAGDHMNHGSIVLQRLTALLPSAPLILVRAFGDDGGCLRTRWQLDRIVNEGWTEAYRWAVHLAQRNGMRSVANCSFGGSTHAVDGTGWESFQLGQETGPGKPGHIVVAAAGAGDGSPHHASFDVPPGGAETLLATQAGDTVYNLWAPPVTGACDWSFDVDREFDASVPHQVNSQLTVERLIAGVTDPSLVMPTVETRRLTLGCRERSVPGALVPPNIWNGRQQFTFKVQGAGKISIKVHRSALLASGGLPRTMRFECWKTEGSGMFLNHVDPTMVMEPAVFPHVLAVGLRDQVYSATQRYPGAKPDVLLTGSGQVSFHTADVTAAVARVLATSETELDITGVRSLLGKYPDIASLLS